MTAGLTAASDAVSYDTLLIQDAWTVFTQAAGYPWNDTDREDAQTAVLDLAHAVRDYRRLVCGIVPAYWPGLPAGPEALSRALRAAAESAQEIADHLALLMGTYSSNSGGN